MKRIWNALVQIITSLTLLSLLASCAKPDTSYTSGFVQTKSVKVYKKKYQQADNLWTVLGNNFNLPDESESNPAVAWQIKWFVQNPIYLKHMAENAAPYLYYIYQQVKKRHLPAELTLLPMVESAYDPFATNYGSSAAGLWQMVPGTASGFGLRVDWWYDGRRDVIESTKAALNYFVFLGKFFDDNWQLAIAAYDSGEGTVQKAMEKNEKAGKPTDFWYLALPYETETYVPKLLALAAIIKNPAKYDVTLPPVKNAPYLAQVNVGSQIDLARAAKLANMSLKQLTDLNPGFNRWATDPKGSHTLVMPEANAIIFKRGLKKLPKSERVSWHREVVGEGETIFSIAHKYQTSVELVRKVNHLVTNTLSVGQVLLVPSGSSKVSNLVLNNERHFIESHYNQPTLQITRHEVKKGETLSQIAKKYHVKVSDIRFWNSLPGNTVDPGTSLVIWPPHARHQSYYKQPTMLHYRVRPGESLWDVAIRYNVHVDTLAKLNHAENGVIRPDQIILVPIAHHYSPILPGAMHHGPLKITNYTVQPGDSIFSIAKKHSMSRKDLLQLNKLKPNAILKPKQTLKVY